MAIEQPLNTHGKLSAIFSNGTGWVDSQTIGDYPQGWHSDIKAFIETKL